MDLNFVQLYTLVVVIFLVFALYKEVFNPAFTFFICTVALLLPGVITPLELLKGLSNQQIIIIFLLVLVTAGIRFYHDSRGRAIVKSLRRPMSFHQLYQGPAFHSGGWQLWMR